jgi:hypothetical protein
VCSRNSLRRENEIKEWAVEYTFTYVALLTDALTAADAKQILLASVMAFEVYNI